jgi:hypothetical protein
MTPGSPWQSNQVSQRLRIASVPIDLRTRSALTGRSSWPRHAAAGVPGLAETLGQERRII